MNDVMSPEDYAKLLQLGGQNAMLGSEMEQQSQKSAMLRKIAPQLANVRNGGRFLVHNPMETLGNTLAQAAAMKGDQAAGATQGKMNQNIQTQNQMIMAALLRGKQQPQPPMVPPQQDPYQGLMMPGGV